MWLLDTNVWIAFLNKKLSPVQSRILTVPVEQLLLCDVVQAELYYGAYKSLKVTENLLRLLANCVTLVTHNTREFSRIPRLELEDWEI